MDSTKHIGMDVHKEPISIAVMDSAGKLVMESSLETKAQTILQFVQGLRGDLQVTFEEGTWAAWLYDLLKPHITKVVVCNPRRNALLKTGNKSDRNDARKLAELLRAGLLSAVYHGQTGIRTLKELSRSYLTISKDLTVPDLLRTNQPERRVPREPLSVVEVFISSQAAIAGLPQQVGEGELGVLPTAGVRQMLFDQFSESESLVKFAHQDQAAVGSDAGALEIDFERSVEGELKRLILYLTHWVLTSGASSSRSHPHQY